MLDEKEQAFNFLEQALEIEDETQKAQIKEQIKKQTYFDDIKNSETYQAKFQKLIEE